MKTLFVGAGATGGYFGGELAAAGRDVTFLVRPARSAQLAERGLRIRTPDGETVLQPRLVTAEALDEPYDLIVLAVKAYALEQAMADLAPAVGERSVIVPLLNGMRHVDTLVGRFGAERVYGGVCMIAGTLTPDGDIVRMTGMQRIGFGPLDGADDRLDSVTEALSGSSGTSSGLRPRTGYRRRCSAPPTPTSRSTPPTGPPETRLSIQRPVLREASGMDRRWVVCRPVAARRARRLAGTAPSPRWQCRLLAGSAVGWLAVPSLSRLGRGGRVGFGRW